MPELPEVETMVRGIRSAVEGRTIIDVRRCPCACKPCLVSPTVQAMTRRSEGLRIERAFRVAKRIVLELESGDAFAVEPRMTGLMLLADPPDPEHLRVEWRLADADGRASSLWFWDRRGLGTVRLHSAKQFVEKVRNALGPDGLRMTEDEWRNVCRGSRRAIKVLLLDQTAVAGIGNLYASEILHRAGIHPEQIASRLSPARVKRLAESVPAILEAAILHEGSTLSDGTYRNALNLAGGYQNEHRVYQRANEICGSCGRAAIRRIVQAQRATFYCPVCQRR